VTSSRGDSGLERLVHLSREALGEALSPSEQAGLERLEQTLLPVRPRVRRWVWAMAGLTMAGAGALAIAGALRPTSDALTFRVEGATISDGGYVRQTAHSAAAIRFSEGTEFALAAGSRARVTGLDADGAHVLLESGAARVHVTPRPRAHWSVDAGPYTIRVTGTAFDVAWSGGEELLDLSLHHGQVVVSGPLAAQGLVLEPGQHLVANVKAGVIRLDDRRLDGPAPAAEPDGVTEAPQPVVEPASPSRAQSTHVRRVPASKIAGRALTAEPPASWAARLARGDFNGIVADAEGRGIDETLRAASAEDLASLADAARYARRTDLAQRVLLAERGRFPRSVPGRDAAFFLGGLAEEASGPGPAAAALSWYDRYLRESPRGTYASQALGRKMVMKGRLGETQEARSVAAEYLRQFPGGPYGERARALLRD
jgi:hypothetical protein